MSNDTNDTRSCFGEFGKKIEQIRRQVVPGGPPVDYGLLFDYIDEALTGDKRFEVQMLISTWQVWFDAYSELKITLDLHSWNQQPDTNLESETERLVDDERAIPSTHGAQAVGFLHDIHKDCYLALNASSPTPGPMPTRGIEGAFTSHEVWTIILAVLKLVAPSVLASVFVLFWNDVMGRKTVDASDVDKKLTTLERMLLDLTKDVDGFQDLLESGSTDAATAELVRLGWNQKKARLGIETIKRVLKNRAKRRQA